MHSDYKVGMQEFLHNNYPEEFAKMEDENDVTPKMVEEYNESLLNQEKIPLSILEFFMTVKKRAEEWSKKVFFDVYDDEDNHMLIYAVDRFDPSIGPILRQVGVGEWVSWTYDYLHKKVLEWATLIETMAEELTKFDGHGARKLDPEEYMQKLKIITDEMKSV